MRILIVGAGAIGFQLCKQLTQHDHDITIVELDPRRARRASELLDVLVVSGNGTSVRTLREAHIGQTDVVAAMTTNEDANILACRLAKRLGATSTIARVRNPEYTLPDFPQVSVAAGFSGHGFKHSSVVGEIMADLVQHGETPHDIGLFRLGRFG